MMWRHIRSIWGRLLGALNIERKVAYLHGPLFMSGPHRYSPPPIYGKDLWLRLKIFTHLVSKNVPWTVINAGAHLGEYILASRYHPGQVVLGFEPNPHVYALLRKSTMAHPDKEVFQVFQFALSDQTGRRDFYVDEVKSRSSSFYHTNSFASEPKRISVIVNTIDSLLLGKPITQCTDYCLMRINAEGEDLKIIRGARRYIASCKECVIFLSFSADHFADAGENVRLEYERLTEEWNSVVIVIERNRKYLHLLDPGRHDYDSVVEYVSRFDGFIADKKNLYCDIILSKTSWLLDEGLRDYDEVPLKRIDPRVTP